MRSRLARAACCVLLAVGCRQDMHDQPRYRPLAPSPFFGDDQASRSPVAGTVARGQLRTDRHRYTGRLAPADAGAAPQYAATFPFPIDAAGLDRGQQRFDIFCSPCHGLAGDGDGMIVRRGFKAPPSLHDPRLVQAPAGYVFDVITGGMGTMAGYGSRVPADDRWRIVAYVRALQLSRSGT